jgi:hypothetical protein
MVVYYRRQKVWAQLLFLACVFFAFFPVVGRGRANSAVESKGQLEQCARRLIIWAHHKTGTVMGRGASRVLNPVLNQLCNATTTATSFECESRPEIEIRKILKKGALKGTCFLHLVRDPREIVVSGYLYHRRADEKWSRLPMSQLDDTYISSKPSWNQLYLRGVLAVREAASRNQFGSQLLPSPIGDESYADYLVRIPPEAGLLAEYVAASQQRLPFLALMHDSLRNYPCAHAACLADFSGPLGTCERTWERTLLALRYPSAWVPKVAAHAAQATCPKSPAVGRANKHDATLQKGTIPTAELPSVLMANLVDLDRRTLGGALAHLAETIDCSRSPHYWDSGLSG